MPVHQGNERRIDVTAPKITVVLGKAVVPCQNKIILKNFSG